MCGVANHKHYHASTYTAANDNPLLRNHKSNLVTSVLFVSVLSALEGTFCSPSSLYAILLNGKFWLDIGCRSNLADLVYPRLVRESRIAAGTPRNTLQAIEPLQESGCLHWRSREAAESTPAKELS